MKKKKSQSIHVSPYVNITENEKRRNRYMLWSVRMICCLLYMWGIYKTLSEYVEDSWWNLLKGETEYWYIIGAGAFLAVLMVLLLETVVKGRMLWLDLAGAGAVLGELIVKTSFEGSGIFLILCSSMILHVMKNKKLWYTDTMLLRNGLWAAVMIVIAGSIGKALASDLFLNMEDVHKYVWNIVNQAEKDITEKLYKNNFHAPEWADAGTYISTEEGSISHESMERKDQTDIVVTLSEKPHSTMYFRGFIGSTYEGTYWNNTDEKSFEEFFSEEINGAELSDIMVRYISSEGALMDQTVKVKRIHADTRYAYIPYGFQTPADAGQKADGSYESEDEENEFQGCINWNEWIGEGPGENPESELEERYRHYAAEQYLKVPIYGLERLEEYCDGYNFETAQEVIDFVISDVRSGREYCLEVDKCPQDADIVENFLFNEKKGFCVHYASASVLMMRMMGVPARYVTGYVAFPEQFKEKDGKYTANIPNEQAHAWIEVYRNGKGWIPMEVTPGYDKIPQNAPEEQSQEKMKEKPQEQQEKHAEQILLPAQQQEEVQQKKNHTEKEEDREQESVSIYVGTLSVVCILSAAALVMCVIWRCIRCSVRKRKYYQKNRKEAVKELSYDLYKMICDSGIKLSEGSEREFAAQVEDRIETLEDHEYTTFIKTVERASFGTGRISKEEWEAGMDVYKKLSIYFYQRMGVLKKVWWKYIKGYLLS